jgi:hypothetical protein
VNSPFEYAEVIEWLESADSIIVSLAICLPGYTDPLDASFSNQAGIYPILTAVREN